MAKIPVCPICGSDGWENFTIKEDEDLPPEAECLRCRHEDFVIDILQDEAGQAGPRSKLMVIMLVSGVTALLLWIPVTRMIILAILPLGYKADDILVFALLIFGVVGFLRGWVRIPFINIIKK